MSAPMRRTPLYDAHVKAGAKLVPFAGYEMPVRYAGEKFEHRAVREAVGLFDVSHMGEVFIEGPRALDAVQRLFTNDFDRAEDGQALYTALTNARGTFVDDCIVYRFSAEKWLVCVNASRRAADVEHLRAIVGAEFDGTVTLRDESDAWAQIAVQGPKAWALLGAVIGPEVEAIAPFRFAEIELTLDDAAVPSLLARTGYTGEDGGELYLPSAAAPALWQALLDAGAEVGVTPCGLAARDTLRLEAGLCLYGNDIDEEHTPLEAGLGWVVKLDKRIPFVGHEALTAQKRAGVTRRLRGIEMKQRAIPRPGYALLHDNAPVGVVTSGTHVPFLDRPVAMAYVDVSCAEPGTALCVDVRGRPKEAVVVKLPFYRRPRA